jgi:hypothetical protein
MHFASAGLVPGDDTCFQLVSYTNGFPYRLALAQRTPSKASFGVMRRLLGDPDHNASECFVQSAEVSLVCSNIEQHGKSMRITIKQD